jgi:hypothetical protein
MKRFIETMSNFVLPYRFLKDPEYVVSRNLLTWDPMVRSLS